MFILALLTYIDKKK
ncbi:hypothetical protein MH139_06095 [Bacillus altitudinis]|nr:hypothetical protein [Bacillus safensis]MCY7590912.1 hypothetical protein [Bacillus altitudinis]